MKKKNFRWAFKTLILSIALSIVFSVASQSMFPNLPNFLSIFVIFFFIVVSVIFDMISVAVTSIDFEQLEKYKNNVGFSTAVILCENTEKVSSFCGDVVGDICGILSGAGGVSLVLNMHIIDQTINFIVTCLISSFIAGLTIFGKAIMKNYSVENCEMVVMTTSRLLETSPLVYLKRFCGIIKTKFTTKSKKKKNIKESNGDKARKIEKIKKNIKK